MLPQDLYYRKSIKIPHLVLFDSSFSILFLVSTSEIIKVSINLARQYFSVSSGESIGSGTTPLENQIGGKQFFLNTDGAIQLDSGNVAIERLIRDEKGMWISGYNRFIRKCFIFNVKLWAILDGLKLIQRRDHDKVIIQSDSLEIVKAIQGRDPSNSNLALIRRIQNILAQEKPWLLTFIPRDQNQVADCLAKLALAKKGDMQIYDLQPTSTLGFL